MKNQIIVAMDMGIEDGLNLMDKTINNNGIYGYKIGSLWILDELIAPEEKGKVFRELKPMVDGTNKKIILDMQKWGTDIPDIIKKQVEKVAPYIDELICCPMGAGSESLKMFAKTCIENNVKPICVLEMTHPESSKYLDKHYYKTLLKDAFSFNVSKFVIPATKEPDICKKDMFRLFENHYDIEFYATGFKVQGGQTKPMVDFGVTKFIVGRAVYEAENPIEEIENIYKEINGM